MPCWDDPSVDWSQFDVAVLRSTWDYAERIDEFLAWIAHCAVVTRLENPPEIVRWNTDKRYLQDLARAGVPVVPTRFVVPGADASAELDRFLAGGPGVLSVGHVEQFADFVVKPSVGAASRDAARYRRADRALALAHLSRLLDAGRHTMLQPYLDRVDQQGETALMYFEGEFSHAVRKGPILRAGADLVAGLFAREAITARVARHGRALRSRCRACGPHTGLAAVCTGGPDPRRRRSAGRAGARADRAVALLRALRGVGAASRRERCSHGCRRRD